MTAAPPELPPPPDVVRTHFAPYQDQLIRYCLWLAGAGTQRGLLGPRETPRLWDRHILNSAVLAELLPPNARVVDVGSGAGLPGLVLACVRPDLQIDLVEPLLRRATFLTEVVDDFGFGDRVRVLRGRADEPEVVKTAGGASFVTARAVAPLDRLTRWSLGLLRSGGNLYAIKGQRAAQELEEHRAAILAQKADIVGIIDCGSTIVDPPIRVVHIRQG